MNANILYFSLLITLFGLEFTSKTFDFYKNPGLKSKHNEEPSRKDVEDDNLSPKIKLTKISANESGNIGRVYFSENSQTFAILTFNDSGNLKSWSNLYISRDMGSTIQKIDSDSWSIKAVIDDVYVNGNIIIAVDKKINLICSSNNGGLKFTFFFLNDEAVDDIIFHPKNPQYIAAVIGESETKIIYISDDSGKNWELVDYNVIKFKWSPSQEQFYYTKDDNGKHHNLYRLKSGEIYQDELILKNVINLDAINDLIYVTQVDNGTLKLYISQNDGPFRIARFPQNLNATEFQVRHSTKNNVYVSLRTQENKRYLFSSLLVDLRFVRIAETEPYHNNDSNLFCSDVKIFENLPGVLIGNIKIEGAFRNQYPSMISFSHGAKWDHVISTLSSEIPECKFQSCYFSLIQSCDSLYDKGIITVSKSPNLILAHGNIVGTYDTYPTNFYISSDAGLNWYLALKGKHSFTVLNHGSIIVSYPEESNKIYYSYDEGREWKYSNIIISNFYAQVSYHDESSKALISMAFGYDNDDGKIVIVQSDFSQVLPKKCNQSDYVDFTPGADSKTKCFQGKKNPYQKRIHEALCYNLDHEMISPNSVDCPCTEDDFECNFGNYMYQGKCYPDPDYTEEKEKPCNFGKFYFKDSKTRKLLGDSCIETEKTTVNMGICGLDEESRSIVFRVGNTYRMMSLKDGIPKSLVNFPMMDKLKQNSTSFAIDISNNCLYFSSDKGIRQLCWNSLQDAEISESKLYLSDNDIHSIQIDNVAQNLYFQDSLGINVLSIENKYRKLIISKQRAGHFKIFPTLGLLVTVDFSNNENMETINFSDMNGTLLGSCDIKGSVIAISESLTSSLVEIYTLDSVLEIGRNFSILRTSENINKDLIDVEVKYGTRYFLTKTGIIYNDSLIEYPVFDEMHIYDDRDLKFNPCSKSSCQYLCSLGIENTYTCLCPNDMKIVSEISCECDDSHPDCKACEGNEFKCNNDKCISIAAKCNGINDCGDGSDEQNCYYTCDADQFICGDNITCIGIEFLCDGFKNCQDGSDESDCKQINPCDASEFACLNGICIPMNKVCDGQNNCGDYSDEEDCENEECKKFEFKCKQGGCILKEYVCDGNFDCLDWSDEENCKTNDNNSTKPDNCTIWCDKCIPKSKVCDHIADCKGAADEIDCGYDVECPADFDLGCFNDYICYSKELVCNGFDPCPNSATELECPDYDFCEHPFNFHCKTIDQCIDISKYCNGITDCEDNSDENDNCLDDPRVIFLRTYGYELNSVKISFRSINKRPDQKYLVSVIPWKHNKTQNFSFSTFDEDVFVDNLAPCSEYIAHVTLPGSLVGAKEDFVTRDTNRYIPENLIFNKVNSTLSWDSQNYCYHPGIYYVKCESNGNTLYQNFTKANYISVPVNKSVDCRVCICELKIFNYSCTGFSNSVRIKYNSNITLKVVAPIIVILCVSGLAVGCFFLYKYFQNNTIQFTLPTRFHRLFSTKKKAVSTNEHDRLVSGEDEDDLLDSI